jgi:predicted RNase H-like nuclease (RuvC/YqgF family)
MSKQAWLDWESPPARRDEGEIVQKVVAEITRLSVPGYTSPPPAPIPEDKKLLTKAAIERERQRQIEHDERIEALERAEKQLKDDHRRLARQAEQQEAEQRQIKKKERDQEVQQRERQQRDAAERQRLTALEHEWSSFKTRAAQAQFAQQREAYFNDLQKTVDDLGRMANPPAPAEREIIYVEADEPGAGALPRLPTWR